MKKKLIFAIALALMAVLALSACSSVKIEIHTVTYDTNGGELDGRSTVNAQTYSMLKLPVPTKPGYVFLGWYVGEGVNEKQFTATDMVTGDITLKAKWTKAEYTVTFIDYYGNVIGRSVVQHGETAEAPTVPRIAEECLRFDSWDTDISSITEDTEVKALYVLDAYTVTYVTNNSQTIPTTSYFFDETPIAPPSPGLGGHYFIGWYLDEEFTTEYLFDAPLTENITLYAYFNDSIPIATLEDLLAIEQHSSNNYFLKNDIDCNGAVITSQIIGFSGVLDGEGHKIHNFVFHPTSANQVGLFATNGGTIKNLYLDDISFSLSDSSIAADVGVLVGKNGGKIENVHITGATMSYIHESSNSTTGYFGGISGRNEGEILGCSVSDSTLYAECVSSSWYDSGTRYSYVSCAPLAGLNSGSICDCGADTTVTAFTRNNTSNSSWSDNFSRVNVGGLVAENYASISSCNATVKVTGSGCNYRSCEVVVGGLASVNHESAKIEKSLADATITLNSGLSWTSAGGFLHNNYGSINNCQATLSITNVNSSARFGGFVSENNGGIYKCYAAGEMSVSAATSGKGSFVGRNNGSINSSFSAVNITATDATGFGAFVGVTDSASMITNCYYNMKSVYVTNGAPQSFDVIHVEMADQLSLTDETFLTETLGWSAEDWSFDANKFKYPTVK